MYNYGFVKLNRNITEWAWYTDANTLRVFLYLLLKANFADKDFNTRTIKRGQLVIGRKKLADELKLSEREVRTALNHLKTTNEIAIETTSQYSIITVNSYNEHQQATNEMTSDRPTRDQQTTSFRPHLKKYNNYNKNNKYNLKYDESEIPESVRIFESKSLFND